MALKGFQHVNTRSSDVERTKVFYERLGLRAGEYLLFLSTIEPRKNLARILEALGATPPEVGPLVLAGGSGWNNEAIRDAIARLARAGRVRELGSVPDAPRDPVSALRAEAVAPSSAASAGSGSHHCGPGPRPL